MEGLARDATVPQLWVQRALVSQQQGRFGEALDALRQAELLAPKLPEVHLNLAYALEVEGNRLVALKHYRTFLTLTEGQQSLPRNPQDGAGPHQSVKQNLNPASLALSPSCHPRHLQSRIQSLSPLPSTCADLLRTPWIPDKRRRE